MFSIKSNPSSIFHISLSLSSFNSSVNTVEFSNSGGELFFGISKKTLGVSNSFVTWGSGRCVHIHVVFIFWEESITHGNKVIMNTVTFSLSIREFIKKSLDHIYDITKISLCRHVKRKLRKNGFSKWVLVDLSKNIHVLFLG